MAKGKKPAKIAGRSIVKEPQFVTVMVKESYTKPSGHLGTRTKWEKVPKEEWDTRMEKLK